MPGKMNDICKGFEAETSITEYRDKVPNKSRDGSEEHSFRESTSCKAL